MIRITIAVPEAHIADANQLALCLGYSEADGETYGSPQWQDADGNLYAVASLMAVEAFLTDAQSPLVAPEWPADLEAAQRAQALVVLWVGEDEETPIPAATPGAITAIAYVEPMAALAGMGLARIPEDEE